MASHYEGATEAERRELDRVGAFSDGVFAIAITLLVLNIEVPNIPDGESLSDGLRTLDDDLVAYFIGFAVMGKFWYEHHKLFSALVRSDRRLILVNLVLLSLVALMPFSTNVMGSFDEPLAVAVYAVNVAAAAAASGLTELVAARSGLAPPGAIVERGAVERVNGWVVAIFLLSIPIAYLVSPGAGQLFWLTLLLIPRLSRRQKGRKGGNGSPQQPQSA